MAAKSQRAERGVLAFVDTWRECFAQHNLLTWASAIAFQALDPHSRHGRKDATPGEKGLFERARSAFG
jgi:hypothetical protein